MNAQVQLSEGQKQIPSGTIPLITVDYALRFAAADFG